MAVGPQNKIVAIIQARMKSSRLHGKILMPMPIDGEASILESIINQLKKSQFGPDIYIATSSTTENDTLEFFANNASIKINRGSENNVLDRFITILEENTYDTCIRITADNPILDVELLDKTIEGHLSSDADYTKTEGLPLGMNFEVFNSQSLLSLKDMVLSPQDKEHVTPKLRDNNSFLSNVIAFEKSFENQPRLTIDYPEDYLVVSSIFQLASKYNKEVNLDFIKFIDKEYPWLITINAKKTQKKIYSDFKEELEDVIPMLNELEFDKTVEYLKLIDFK